MSQGQGASAGISENTRKAAALLLAMGKPLAERLLKHFSEAEIRRVVETTAKLGAVPRQKIEQFVDEIAAAVEKGADIHGSSDDVEGLLAGIVPPEQLAVLMSTIRPDSERPVWVRLAEIPETAFVQFIGKEHPQIIAIILANTGPGMAAAVLRQLPGQLRSEVVRRILALGPVTDSALAILEGSIRDELLVKITKETGPPVHSRVADIINKFERQQMEEVLSDLEQRRPKDAKLVKGLLFTFDDILRLTPGDRVKLFDGVPAERTILALQGASNALREVVLSSVSSRSRRMIEQEVASGGNAPMREIMKARRIIADLALELAERGEIDVAQQEE